MIISVRVVAVVVAVPVIPKSDRFVRKASDSGKIIGTIPIHKKIRKMDDN